LSLFEKYIPVNIKTSRERENIPENTAMRSSIQTEILRFSPTIDSFISLLPCCEEDLLPLLLPPVTRESYMKAVLKLATRNYEKTVDPHVQALMAAGDPLAAEHLEEEIFQLCIEINPQLSLEKVSLKFNSKKEKKIALKKSFSSEKLQGLQKFLLEGIFGQEEAIQAVCQNIRQASVGLSDPERPLASFLFAGPTGVGKTEMAKLLSYYLFPENPGMIRIDCSEYSLPHEVAKLTGAPPGYVGHESGGILSEKVSTQKEGVLLFDEIEKADPKVHYMLLQLLDEGHLTDSHGKFIDFRNFIVILTTNSGSEGIDSLKKSPGFHRLRESPSFQQIKSSAFEGIRENFAPEFLNRLDQTLVFNALTEKLVENIVRKFCRELVSRCNLQGIELKIKDEVIDFIAKKSSGPLGGRDVKRQINSILIQPLTDLILAEELKETRVVSEIKDGVLNFHCQACPTY
jgi:ATP-dependent Clp protease ATP-binding subunit ClpA